jgi:acetylornithine deacetylase/succinyl-diaminopimelate desuccinylase-like protein
MSLALCLVLAATTPPQAYQDLAREVLQELVETNTTHAFGSRAAADKLAARLKAAGFPAQDVQVLGQRPEKGNVVVRMRGTGSEAPILFLSHLDVVEARPEDWSVDPFKLTEREGWFYGRGTLDIKDEVANLVTNLIRLKAEGFVPRRDIIVALTDDEEAGDENGAAWLVESHRELVQAAYVINTDAGGGQIVKGVRMRNPVQTSEKTFASFRLEVTNPGGHSSMPTPENAIYRLAEALVRLSRFALPVRLTDTTREFFRQLGTREGGATGTDMLAVLRDPPDPAAVERLSASPLYNATLRTTCVATLLEGGHAENALPQRARATIQCRLLPGDAPEEVRAALVRAVADPQVAVTLINEPKPSPGSPVSPEVMGAVEAVTARMWPGVLVLPVMDVWSSDSIQFRRAGIPAYGISGVFFDVDDVRAHGKDERVSVDAFFKGQEYLYRLVKALAGGKSGAPTE